MNDCRTRYVGLDVHKDTIAVAVADEGREDAESLGTITATKEALLKLVNKLASSEERLVVAYEAGPTGYGVWRTLKQHHIDCIVVAPSLIPHAPGDQVKTDRKDALKLARLLRSGLLASVHVPRPEDEALRNLVRLRHDSKVDETRAKQRLSMFLLRMDVHPPVGTSASKASKRYQTWLNTVKWDHAENTIVFDTLVSRLRESTDRVGQLDGALVKCVENHPQHKLIAALQTLRGIAFLSAVTIVAEVGDFDRFPNGPSFMSFVGVVPREHSSGKQQRRGGITKVGDSLLRHVLVESAHHARHQPLRSELLKKRQEGIPQEILDISWKAQNRLHEKYRHLAGRIGTQKAVTAVAREYAGFVWAIAKATH